MTASLISYHIATKPLSQTVASAIEYWFAQNGVFVRAQRPGLHVLIPVSGYTQAVKGLHLLQPFVTLTPRVPGSLLTQMLRDARHALPNEVLFHLVLANHQWQLITPEQVQSPTQCQPDDTCIGSSTHQALIEVHSHGTMPAYFSPTDDADECHGFRVYGVMGRLDQAVPELLLRVGVFGHAYTIPADLIVTAIQGVQDLTLSQGCRYYTMQGGEPDDHT